MKLVFLLTVATTLALNLSPASADTFGSEGTTFTIDFVTIGDPGNPADSGTTGSYFSPHGAVGHTFRIGVYEVSEDMINKANTLGESGHHEGLARENRPATSVSWNEAARFVNWLNLSEGYPAAYKFILQPGDPGYSGNGNIELWSASDAGFNPNNPYRNSNAHYFLPSEDEWYKAAFYSGNGTTYYDYATGSDTIPTGVTNGTASGSAVYGQTPMRVPANITQAGGLSHYETMGQNGNVWEWQESAFVAQNDDPSEIRVKRGGYWGNTEDRMRCTNRISSDPANSDRNVGFRVASVVEVPHPPRLNILRTGPAQVTISWKSATPGFVLQESLSLAPSAWTNSASGAANPVTVPITPPMKFFRLVWSSNRSGH